MERKTGEQRLYTRRTFLKGVPFGVAAALILGVVSRRVFSSTFGRDRRFPRLPKDSIFTPANDRRKRL
jgi:hypothetical protein